MIVYTEHPIATDNPQVWIIGRRLNQWERHAGWIVHFGSFDGAVEALKAAK